MALDGTCGSVVGTLIIITKSAKLNMQRKPESPERIWLAMLRKGDWRMYQ
jgi:hypothetical protein